MASPFASLIVSDPIPLPFDEGQWIKVRKLTGKQYERVQEAHRAGFVSGDRWAGFFRAASLNPTSEDVRRILHDPLTGHDRYALVREGLVAWSYLRAIAPVEGDDAIADLDDDAVDFIAREVLKLAKPSLFIATADDSKAAQVKD
jgi:hypothetical protein